MKDIENCIDKIKKAESLLELEDLEKEIRKLQSRSK